MNKAAAARNIEVLASNGRRPEAARQLLGAWRGHSVTVDELKTLLADIWLYLDPPVAPYGPLAVAEWLELFGATGFFMQGPPIHVVDHERWVLYRAAPEDRARSMSWCTSRVMAERFIPARIALARISCGRRRWTVRPCWRSCTDRVTGPGMRAARWRVRSASIRPGSAS